MATWTYIAADAEGRRACGVKSAPSEATLKEYLSKKGLSGAVCCESRTKYSIGNYKAVSPKTLSMFCRQMAILFFSQITFMEGVALLAEQSESKELKIALGEIYDHMAKGRTFAEAMGMYPHIFGEYLINMVFIGEASGTLEKIFSMMSGYFDKEDKTRRKIMSAVLYPAMLSALMGVIVLLLVLKILPMFQETLYKMGYDIPGITKIILNVSYFINLYLPHIAFGIAAIVPAAVWFHRTDRGKAWRDRAKATYPVSRYIYARIVTTRFSRSVAILLKSGVQLLNALDETKALIGNQWLDQKFAETVAKVKEGGDLADALAGMNIFPPLFLKTVAIGQATGHLDELLEKSADFFEDEVDESLERLKAMLEPLLIMILSGVVGVILLSVMIPMISIMNNIA